MSTNNLKNRVYGFYNNHLIVRMVVVFVLCTAAGLFFNRDVEFRSLFLDDLQNYHFSLTMPFMQYVFGITEGQVHYRPVFYGALYIICRIITGHVGWVYAINTVIQSVIGTTVYCILEKLGVRKIIALAASLLYIASHFSYHQVAQMIGPIESISLFLAMLILYMSVRYLFLDEGRKKKYDFAAIIVFYVLIVFTHERYLGLLIPIILTVLLDKENTKTKVRRSVTAVLVFVVFMLIRYMLLGRVVPAGTDKSDLSETFTIGSAIISALKQAAMVFGFNIGPQHLVGIDFVSASAAAKAVIVVSCLFLIVLTAVYLTAKIRTPLQETGLYGRDFRVDIIILASIVMYICSASVNYRLEMRWIYVSFTAALIYGMYMFTYILKHRDCFRLSGGSVKVLAIALITGFFVTRFGVELYYHGYYDNLYIFMYLDPTNSLSDITVRRIPKEELDRTKIYLVSNKFDLYVGQMQLFYEPFYGERYDGSEIFYVITDELDEIIAEREASTGQKVTDEEYEQLYHDLIKQHVYEENTIVLVENYADRTYVQMSEYE